MSNNQRPVVPVASMAITYFTVLIVSFFFTMDIAEAGYYGTVSFTDCGQKGTDETDLDCFSFFTTDNGKGDCAVNSKNDPPVVLGPCDSNPCHFTAECTVSADGTDFSCNCPPPTSGKTCEDLDCGQCFRMGTLVVYTDTSTSMSWVDSYVYCSNKGLTMFMDKSWTTHGFILGVLSELKDKIDYPSPTFWMGLSREMVDAPFKYLDRTEVTSDSFTVWGEGYPKNDLFVGLTGGLIYFRWNDQPGDTGQYNYPLCQGTYDFLSHY